MPSSFAKESKGNASDIPNTPGWSARDGPRETAAREGLGWKSTCRFGEDGRILVPRSGLSGFWIYQDHPGVPNSVTYPFQEV